MHNFTFHPGPRLVAGAGEAASLAGKLPDGPCLFVTDQQIVRLGLADSCRAALEAGGKPVVLFDSVEADPSRATLEAAVAAGEAMGVRSVIGFGGGSPMDVAKLAAYLLGSADDLDSIWGVDIAKGQRLPLVLVPGPGSVLYRGLGTVLVGGMAVNSVFTLVLLPTLLRLMERPVAQPAATPDKQPPGEQPVGAV